MSTEKKLNILIADDEEGLRFSLASILEMEGYFVSLAGDGLEALELVKNNPFDVAFFDIRMPGMNGVEAFKKIKEISPETIVVMMTAYAMNDLIKEAIKEGAFACISKPFEIEDVLNTIKEINSKKTGLVIATNGETKDFLLSCLKTAGFIAAGKENLTSAGDFIGRRKPELIFIAEPQKEDYDAIKETAGKLEKSEVVAVISEECKEFEGIKNIKCVKPPVSKSSLSGFFAGSDKKRAALISSDAIWSNNLKLAVIAKGYDVSYHQSSENFFDESEIEKYDFVVCDSGEVQDIDAFYRRVKEKNEKAKVIFVFDFESSASGKLKELNISFLQKPFDSRELLAVMEKA